MRRRDPFITVRTEGSILPPDLLGRIAQGDTGLGGLSPEDYHLSGERLNEAISRAWNTLRGAWTAFKEARDKLVPGEPGIGVTRERWLLPLFRELDYGRLEPARALSVDGKSYPISHIWQRVPIHLVGVGVDLDTRTTGVAGAARVTPHGLVQEFLNRSDDHLWGFVSNGLRLRVLRDNRSLTRPAYLEFDLEAIMEDEVYSDFVLLWLVCHQSRVEAERPEECWLERWSRTAQEQGTRALDKLRDGVQEAIRVLGQGFLAHPANQRLREDLRDGVLNKQDFYRELLRLVYRLIFLFAAEDRGLLFAPGADSLAKETYLTYFSTARLRKLAEKRRGGRHSDLYQAFCLVVERLGSDEGCPELGLPPLGGYLFSQEATPHLNAGLGKGNNSNGAHLANADFLAAVRALAFTTEGGSRRPVDYRNLGSEELGSVYESLLELHPDINIDSARFELRVSAGSERKSTGSYYTPSSLIQCLLDSALEPVIAEAMRQPNPEEALLNLKICDPACGSGHFLVAAAHRLAKRLAALRTGDEEPSPEALRQALRDVIGRCLYGVDVNPMAVELCKVSLWMEALEPGKPLSFLEHRILCGNSLLGTTPALLADGIPDEAFKPLEGDDKEYVSALRRRNKQERAGQTTLLVGDLPAVTYRTLADAAAELARAPDDSVAALHEKEAWYELLSKSSELAHARLVADAWCAAFVWKKRKDAPPPVTHDLFLRLTQDPNAAPAEVRAEIARLAEQYRFFHWHLAFPDVFRLPAPGAEPENPQAGWDGGFDVVLGNPPWEHTELKEKEFFATVRPDITEAQTGAARKRMIGALAREDPALHEAFLETKRQHDGVSHLIAHSGRYPLCGRGRINTYAVFAETKRLLAGPAGRVGTIIPSGIATDDTTKFFFQDLMETGSLVSLYHFDNRAKLFPAVGSMITFCLLTLAGVGREAKSAGRRAAELAERGEAEFAFFTHQVEDLRDPERRFTLSAADLALLNPNTRTCPVFRTRRDAEITKAVYRRVPVLIKEGPPEENPWGISFRQGLFNMTSDSHLFRTREELEREGWRLEGNVFVREVLAAEAEVGDAAERAAGGAAGYVGRGAAGGLARKAGRAERYLPLYEAKMIHHFDHRWATYEHRGTSLDTRDMTAAEKADPHAVALPRYWVPEAEVNARLAGRWDRQWLLGWRDICRSTDERTVIASVVPRVGVGNKIPLMLLGNADAQFGGCLVGDLCSFAHDYVSRQKIAGTTLNFFIFEQLPVLPPSTYLQPAPWSPTETVAEWMLPRVLELVYTSWELQPFARDCGYDGPPFVWDEERRFQLRCELDAAFFHLYGISREDVDYIMETFPIVKRKDEARWGEYRTKRVVLERYDEMAIAVGR
ncbi:MAG: N-6 DNA methylase [Thermoleophilia bacterium]|nr:N-6 DNA methylase [Thermoleophilia bacterium]